METKYSRHEDSNDSGTVSHNNTALSVNVCCFVNATSRPLCTVEAVYDINPHMFFHTNGRMQFCLPTVCTVPNVLLPANSMHSVQSTAAHSMHSAQYTAAFPQYAEYPM